MVAPASKRILLESDKAAANGVATLGADSKIPDGQFPTRLGTPALDAKYQSVENAPVNAVIHGADPTGTSDSTAAIQAAINKAAATAGLGSGARKVVLPGTSLLAQATYRIDGRVVIPKFVTLEGESSMITIKCGTATAGIDVGDGVNVPYQSELNNITINANFIANNPLVYNKVSELYSERIFVTNITDAGQGIKVVDCLGLTLNKPSISRNSVQPHGIGVGIRVTGSSAGFIVIRDQNFFNLKDAIRFETGCSNMVVDAGWNEWITNYMTVATTAFASFGQLITDHGHFTGTDPTHRLFNLEKADNGITINKARWFQSWFIGAATNSALIDLSAVPNTAGTTDFAIDECSWNLGASATILAKHASTPWYQTYVRIRNFKSMPFAKLPVHGADCQVTAESSLGWNRYANGLSVNGDPARVDGHVKWNAATKRMQVDTTNTGSYSDIPVVGDYSSASSVAGLNAVFATGSYYTPRGARSAFAATADRLTVVPFHVPKNQQFIRIGAEVTVAAAASSIRLGIYNIGSNGLPTTLVLDAGTIDSSTTGAKELTIDVTLPGGLYGLAAVAQGGAPTVRTITGGGGLDVGNGSLASSTQSNPNTGFYAAGVSGPLPATFSLTDRSLSPMLVALRTA
jgi:hypothetical protein